MLTPLLLALAPQVTLDNRVPVFEDGSSPLGSQPLSGPTAILWTEVSRRASIRLPDAYNPTQYEERIELATPQLHSWNGELVVIFHHFGPFDTVPHQLTTQLNAAGYVAIIPQGGTDYWHYGNQRSVTLTEADIAWALAVFPGTTKVHAYGFSMGGGSAASFVAKHPGRFSSLLQHTGTLDLSQSWQDDYSTRVALQLAYPNDGPGSWEYKRNSTLGTSRMGENLAWTPTVVATGNKEDTSWSGAMFQQTEAWQARWSTGILGGTQADPYYRAGDNHAWGWWQQQLWPDVVGHLAGATAPLVIDGSLVIDKDGVWGPMTITRRTQGVGFAQVDLDSTLTTLDLTGLVDVATLEISHTDTNLSQTMGDWFTLTVTGEPATVGVAGVTRVHPGGSSSWMLQIP